MPDDAMQAYNRRLEDLIRRMDEVGKRPAVIRGGSINDRLEYGRLREIILNLCLEAFRAGGRFK